jgi:RNA polymerase sigma-70 factor (ECF subfamily)
MVGEADANDLTQEAMLAASRDLPRLRDPARFGPWLRRILINRCRNVLRSRARHGIHAQLSLDLGSRGSEIADAERRMEVRDGLVTLTDLQRAVVVLHYLLGLSLADVADTLGIPEGTAKSRLHQALTRLRAHFAEDAR